MKKSINRKVKIIPLVLCVGVVVPTIFGIAYANRSPEEFFKEGGWDEQNQKYAWFAYTHSDYDTLGTYLADDSFSNVSYDSWYGSGSTEFSERISSALKTFPNPSGYQQAKLLSYHGLSRDSFIPLMMAISTSLSSNRCEGPDEIVGVTSYYRVIKFSELGYPVSETSPITEAGLSQEKINEARIKYLYELIVSRCYDYENKYSLVVNIDYCSIPMMRVIESLWDKSALYKDLTKYCKGDYKDLSAGAFEKEMLKKDVSDINSSDFNVSKLQKEFPHAYKVMTFVDSVNGNYTPYALCPARTAVSEHNIYDTGSYYSFESGSADSDTTTDSKEESSVEK